jgi:hypothetical protein
MTPIKNTQPSSTSKTLDEFYFILHDKLGQLVDNEYTTQRMSYAFVSKILKEPFRYFKRLSLIQ